MLKVRERTNAWPGFVDLFSNLVIILIFLLIVFVFLWTTTSVFNKGGGGRKVAELSRINIEQAEKLEQMTADEAEARHLLILSRAMLEELESEKIEREQQLADTQSQKDYMSEMVKGLEEQLRVTTAQLQETQQQGQAMAGELELRQQALQAELSRLNELLGAAEAKAAEQEIEYVEMSSRLNKALADKIAELNEVAALNQYQSQFYREIKTALTGMSGIDVSSDRFVVSSDILFPSGSFALSPEGKRQLQAIANIMKGLETKIPTDLNWIIRVDGHTDTKPVIPGTHSFKNNLELSLLRARAVADELTKAGVARKRLVPSGFGELYPSTTDNDEKSLQKNRRIELRLTIP
ncbi:MAG: OmpA family protein [Alphaproteobacteria bacterium]|nr:OmpA family protein [Alphaproteobacteria bacterium]